MDAAVYILTYPGRKQSKGSSRQEYSRPVGPARREGARHILSFFVRVVTLFHGDVHDFSWGARSSRAVVLGYFFGQGITLLSLSFFVVEGHDLQFCPAKRLLVMSEV